MNRFAFCCLFIAALLPATHVSAQGHKTPAWEEPLPTTDNAALIYWQAIALIPKRFEEWQAIIKDDRAVDPKDPLVKAIFAESAPAMRLMRRASTLNLCDWGINRNDGPEALLPHNMLVRQLTRLAMFRSLHYARMGDVDGAIDDAMAILGLARHLSRHEQMIGTLIGYAIEAQGVSVLAEPIPQLSPMQLRRLAQRHATLPPRPPLAASVLLEKRSYLGWLARTVKDGRTEEALDVVAAMVGSENEPWLARLRAESSEKPDALLKLIEQTAPLYDESAELIELPIGTYSKKMADWEARLKKTAHPFSIAVLLPVAQYHEATIRVRARQAVIQAAIAYL